MKKIIIADDHVVVRQGLKKILCMDCRDQFTVVAEAANTFELRDVLKNHRADVLILDISMPGSVGMDVLKEITKEYPELPVLILSFHGEDHYGMLAFRSGAGGYLTKESSSEQLVMALNEILHGRRYFSKRTLDLIFNELGKSSNKLPHQDLSKRELYVLVMLGHGVSLTQISIDLSLSVKTISTYRMRVLKKMKMATNAEIAKYVFTHKHIFDEINLKA